MTPWSVSPKAGWSSSAARAAIASILQAPSSNEYSLWACRWTAEAELTGPSIMPIRADGTGAFCDASARFPCYFDAGEPRTTRGGRLSANPGAGAEIGPDFAGDPVLFGLRGVLGFALAAVEFPGRGKDLVGAAGAARGVEGAVVAARLAHHDVGGNRVRPAEPAADFFFGFGLRGFPRFGCARFLDLVDPFGDVAFQLSQRGFAAGAQRLQPRRRGLGGFANRGDFGTGGFELFVVGQGFGLKIAHPVDLPVYRGADFGHALGEGAVGFVDRPQVVVAGDEVLVIVGFENQGRSIRGATLVDRHQPLGEDLARALQPRLLDREPVLR